MTEQPPIGMPGSLPECQILSRTPSTTWAVVDLRASQVFSPAFRTVLIPPRAARSPLRAFRFRLVLFEALVLVRPLDAAFLAGRFFADERLAEPRFFRVAIMSSVEMV